MPRSLRFVMVAMLVGLVISIIGSIVTDLANAATPTPGSLTGYSVKLQVSKPYQADDALFFKFTATNNATTSLKNVVMRFSHNMRPWGLVDGHLSWTADGKGLKWNIGILRGGESRSITIPIQAPVKAPARVCASASLSSSAFKPFWTKGACYWSK